MSGLKWSSPISAGVAFSDGDHVCPSSVELVSRMSLRSGPKRWSAKATKIVLPSAVADGTLGARSEALSSRNGSVASIVRGLDHVLPPSPDRIALQLPKKVK